MAEIPLLIKIEKARNELRYALNQTAIKYDLPGFVIDLILEGLLSEERMQRIALMAETVEGKEVDDDGGHQ